MLKSAYYLYDNTRGDYQMETIIDYKMIGNRIKKRRNELKLTQEQLANDLNLSVVYISKIENGKATATLETLTVIAHHLQLDISYLITGTSKLEKSYYMKELDGLCSSASNKQLNLIIKLAKAVLDE